MISVFAVAAEREETFARETVKDVFETLLRGGFDFAIVDYDNHHDFYAAAKYTAEAVQRASAGAQIAGASSPFFNQQAVFALPNQCWRANYLRASIQQQVQQRPR